jgi:hypothetical protein
MKVLGVGIGKTGTMSLQAALNQLGYPCYNFGEVLLNYEKGHTDMWNNYMEGKAEMDWHKLYEGYEAAVDNPSNIYYKEIMKVFPDIKFILTLRDPEAWHKSLIETLELHDKNVSKVMFLPSFREFQRVLENSGKIAEIDAPEGETPIEWFNRYNKEAQEYLPADRLLIYNVKEGWGPLCEFLGEPVPDEPFPHENIAGAGVEKILQTKMLKDLLKFAAPYLAGIVILAIIIIFLLTR